MAAVTDKAAEHRILIDRQSAERARDLEGATDARARQSVWRKARHVLAKQIQSSGRWALKAGEQVKQRRLTGAVRPDNADEFVAAHFEVDVVAAL